MTEEQQDAFECLAEADRKYDESNDVKWPFILFFIGCALGFLGLFSLSFGALGGFLCILAVLWEIILVADRAHRYQRLKDAGAEYKRVMAPK